MPTQLTKTPVYCADCRKSKTWKRNPQKDIKSESGKLMWEAYYCSTPYCTGKALEPVKDNL